MWTLLGRDFEDRRWSLLSYCAIALGLLWLYVAIYPSIHDQAAKLNQVVQAYPKGFLKAFNITATSFSSLESFLAVEKYSFTWELLAILLVISRAGAAIAGEIEKGTMAILLALPLRRLQIFLAKYLSGLAALVIFIVASVLATVPLAAIYAQTISRHYIGLLALAGLLFGWTIYSLAIFLSAVFSERGKVYISIGGADF